MKTMIWSIPVSYTHLDVYKRQKLVIAEKPSVAQSLAAVIGATARKDGYLEGGGSVSYTHLLHQSNGSEPGLFG